MTEDLQDQANAGRSNPSPEDNAKAGIAYGCLFCLTGRETALTETIEKQGFGLRGRVVCQAKRGTAKGMTRLQTEVLLREYVFLEADWIADISGAIPREDGDALLTYSDGDWRLCGADEEYARWVFRYNGLIGLSKAHRIGDRIRIVEGS
ncbi:MAG: hypothetical protein LLF96_05360 [Eubacteriales bacterium]|nr:hypothetical protein [Eubacteriales bacterium]